MSDYFVELHRPNPPRGGARRRCGPSLVRDSVQRSGAEFLSELSKVLTRLTENPLIYPADHKDVRRVVIHRFPYLLWYRIVDREVTILACTHGRQDPDNLRSKGIDW